MDATLTCWSCGKSKLVQIKAPPAFAFEIAGFAKDNDWIGVVDHRRGRVVVICDDDCLKAQTTKSGSLRARPVHKEPRDDGR